MTVTVDSEAAEVTATVDSEAAETAARDATLTAAMATAAEEEEAVADTAIALRPALVAPLGEDGLIKQ